MADQGAAHILAFWAALVGYRACCMKFGVSLRLINYYQRGNGTIKIFQTPLYDRNHDTLDLEYLDIALRY